MKDAQRELLEQALKLSRPRPSERNQRIYDAVHVGGCTQAEVAAEHGISPRRVSQICQKVAAWLGSPAWLRGEPVGGEHQRAEEELARRQLEEIYRRAMRAFGKSEQKLVTTKQGQRKGEEWSETSEREQRPDTGSLRVALRAIEQRQKMGKRPPPSYHGPGAEGEVLYLQCSMARLAHLRDEAIRAGAVERGPVDSRRMVEDFLRTLIGADAAGSETRAEAAAAEASDAEEALQPGTMVVGDTVMCTPFESVTPKENAAAGASAREELAHEAASLPALASEGLAGPLSPFGSTEECGAEAAAATDWQDASADSTATCSDSPATEAAAESAEKTRNGRAPTEGDDRRLQQARWQLEDRYGMAMSREQIASELDFLDRWKRGLHRLSQPGCDQLEAMLNYCRLARIPLPKSLRHEGRGVRSQGTGDRVQGTGDGSQGSGSRY